MAPQAAAFIAVQCSECSTMQVKQEKRSSNKWNCVICNQKQSVRRVFARSSLAKDVRQVVQQLNMSRLSADLAPPTVELNSPVAVEFGRVAGPPKRTDWLEYIENVADGKESLGDGCEEDIEVTTELPTAHQMLGKMRDRSNANSNAPHTTSSKSSSRLLTPTFTKRKKSSEDPQPQETVDAKRSKLPLSTASASKWSCYLENDALIGSDAWGEDDLLQSDLGGEQVEEDVHPDFI